MSREIDAKIAEHVMGLGPIIKAYSTDIAAAWEVVERLDEEEWNVTIYPRKHESSGSSVVMHKFHHNYHVHGDIPMAICLAALKAKGIDTSDIDNP